MIDDLSQLTADTNFDADLAIVGAGPAGIVTALEAADRGLKVLLLESGQLGYDPSIQDLSEAATWNPARHAALSIAVRRQVGGTSVIWGGRCVPYDPVDFVTRPIASSVRWPVSYDDLSRYFGRSCDWMRCGRPVFSATQVPHLTEGIVPGLTDGDGVKTTDLERWSLPTDFGRVYVDRLRSTPNLRVLTGVTCRTVVCLPESGRADHLDCGTTAGGQVTVRAKAYVVACGGLESTRLLMSSTAPAGGQLGNGSGHLGRWYMAHVEGVVARARFVTPPRATSYDYQRDVDGTYVRRRFTLTEDLQRETGIPNFAAWLTNPEPADAAHDRGELSFVYLVLTSRFGPRFAPDAQRLALSGVEVPGAPYGRVVPSPRRRHVRTIARHPLVTTRFVASFGTRRFLRRGRRAPGFFSYSPDNVYPLQYHSEHLPRSDSRVSLTRERDSIGRPRLQIDLRFSDADVEGVVRGHEAIDRRLQATGVGRLEYLSADVGAGVESRLGGGFHQMGTTRMAAAESEGVVDANLRLFGVDNVYVVSSSTFVTSSQANSTFMIVAFALRLAEHLVTRLGGHPVASA